jgi:hypothetical protein
VWELFPEENQLYSSFTALTINLLNSNGRHSNVRIIFLSYIKHLYKPYIFHCTYLYSFLYEISEDLPNRYCGSKGGGRLYMSFWERGGRGDGRRVEEICFRQNGCVLIVSVPYHRQKSHMSPKSNVSGQSDLYFLTNFHSFVHISHHISDHARLFIIHLLVYFYSSAELSFAWHLACFWT